MWEFFEPILVDFKNPVIYAIPFFGLFLILEIYINYKERSDNYLMKDTLASISMGLGSVFLDILTKSFAYIAFSWLYLHLGWFKESLSWTVFGFVILFFLDDLTFYWHHRLSHQIRILWAAHVNHHSSKHYNLGTALRQSWAELFYKYSWYIWLPILGFPPLMILTQLSISLIYQFWIHTKHIDQLPAALELVFNSPSHHRVHHAKNVIYMDRNHGGILIIWDRIFGTFQKEDPAIPPIYGITTDINSYNPFYIASHEFGQLYADVKKAPDFISKIKYIFAPPGWSHDGSSLTADQMRSQTTINPSENT